MKIYVMQVSVFDRLKEYLHHSERFQSHISKNTPGKLPGVNGVSYCKYCSHNPIYVIIYIVELNVSEELSSLKFEVDEVKEWRKYEDSNYTWAES